MWNIQSPGLSLLGNGFRVLIVIIFNWMIFTYFFAICTLKLLRQFRAVEKIKLIGSTYMAACRLQSSCIRENITLNEGDKPGPNLKTMVQFASAISQSIKNITGIDERFKQLRIGNSNLSQFIDHHLNIKSIDRNRLRSSDCWCRRSSKATVRYLGWYCERRFQNELHGRSRQNSGNFHLFGSRLYEMYLWTIFEQVTEKTARLLFEEGIQCQFRGVTYVKGKGNIHTYWIASEHVLEKTPKTGFKPTIKQNYIKTKTGIILNTNEETKLWV